MKARNKKILRTVYVVIILLLLLPFAQYHLKIIKPLGLKGTYKKEEIKRSKVTTKELKTGKIQEESAKYWKNELGFRSWFVRVNNQINYSLFDRANAKGTIMGNSNVLLTEADIKSLMGQDFIGEDRMRELLDKAQFVSDTLAKRGIPFFFFITPSKASAYEENIPSRYYQLYKNKTTNYHHFIELAKTRGLKTFDAKAIILGDKSYAKYPIFPKNGIHWSGNTVAKIADTLVDFLSNNLNIAVPDIQLSKGERTIKNYRYTDYDIGEAMNLLWNVAEDELHYPEMKFLNVPKQKPNVLGIGDSFIQSFFGFYPVLDSTFSETSNLWYYNKIMGWPINYKYGSISILKLDLELELRDRDLVFVEMTEENLKLKCYGFIDDLYNHFTGKNKITEEIRPLYNKLLNDPEIQKEAKTFAALVGYSVDEMKHSLAKSKVRNQWLIDFDYDAEVKKIMNIIKGDKKWLASVKEKAIRRGQPLEKMIRDDAVWMVNDKIGKSQR